MMGRMEILVKRMATGRRMAKADLKGMPQI